MSGGRVEVSGRARAFHYARTTTMRSTRHCAPFCQVWWPSEHGVQRSPPHGPAPTCVLSAPSTEGCVVSDGAAATEMQALHQPQAAAAATPKHPRETRTCPYAATTAFEWLRPNHDGYQSFGPIGREMAEIMGIAQSEPAWVG